MSEVTAEQLREALENPISGGEGLVTGVAAQRMTRAARLLADRPLTLAALQAGAEEREIGFYIPEGFSHGVVSAIPDDSAPEDVAVVLVPRSE